MWGEKSACVRAPENFLNITTGGILHTWWVARGQLLPICMIAFMHWYCIYKPWFGKMGNKHPVNNWNSVSSLLETFLPRSQEENCVTGTTKHQPCVPGQCAGWWDTEKETQTHLIWSLRVWAWATRHLAPAQTSLAGTHLQSWYLSASHRVCAPAPSGVRQRGPASAGLDGHHPRAGIKSVFLIVLMAYVAKESQRPVFPCTLGSPFFIWS